MPVRSAIAKTTKCGVVTIVGSLNVDLVALLSRLPQAGETVAATSLKKLFGGKGANQAMAAARAGAGVRMIGCVGDDADGMAYRERLAGEGIDVSGVSTAKGFLTGTALIGVDAAAENLIMVAPEANGRLSRRHVQMQRTAIESADVLLMQFEVPETAVLEAARIANRAGVPVVLNPSPMSIGFPWGSIRVDCLIVNESEARQLFGMSANGLKRNKTKWLPGMEARGVRELVITRGCGSTLHLHADGIFSEIVTLAVVPVDTVGAGDAFAGTFAAFLAAGESRGRCLWAGNCAGALATTQRGAQEAIPSRRKLLAAMKRG